MSLDGSQHVGGAMQRCGVFDGTPSLEGTGRREYVAKKKAAAGLGGRPPPFTLGHAI